MLTQTNEVNATVETIMSEVLQALVTLAPHITKPWELLDAPIGKDLMAQVLEGKSLKFILPAFPAKSPNLEKTSGILPDLGEVIALRALNDFASRISQVYAPGAEVVICSDGRIFSDVVGVSDEVIDQYQAGIDEIIAEFGLNYLRTFAMDDLFPALSAKELRERVLWQFGKCVEEVRHQVITDENTQNLFNGLHRFMLEDRTPLEPHKSRNQINKETKSLTYELMRRSDTWSNVLKHYHRGALRLSIHPYPLQHEKFGLQLVASSSKWATPWHNVTVKIGDRFQLMHKKEAEALGAHKKSLRGKYVYFEV